MNVKTRTATRQEPVTVRAAEYFEPSFSKCYDHVMDLYGYRLGFRDFCIYQTLRRFATREGKKKGKATILLSTIAKIWGVDRRTVKRAIRRLRAFGLVKSSKRQGASEYFLPLVPVPKSRLRRVKNVPSDGPQLSLQRGQEWPTDQRFFTRGFLPRGRSSPAAAGSTRNGKDGPHDVPRGGSRLTVAERATIDYKAVRRELTAIQEAAKGSGMSQEQMLETALHRAGVTGARWREIMEQFK